MGFRLVPKSVTLNDLERRNGVILRNFSEFGSFRGALRKSSRSLSHLSHLLMSSCLKNVNRRVDAFNKGQSPLRYLVRSWFEAGRRPAAN